MSNEDAEYAAFLEKSNKDYSKPSGGVGASTKASEEVVKTSVPEEVHPAINALRGRTYTSDADEEFQPVSLNYEGDGLPSEEGFAKVLHLPSDSEIKVMDLGYWDVHNDYEDVRDAVVAIAGGNASLVKVYRVTGSGARAEYYVLGLAKEKGVLEGVKVLAVES
ncbi:unnamed protein product [Tuber melanosporum]|uniref:(Perigord truffle) hypothetical protein n=1 Tax=Tuber melanosporum (strain Mel28) TaxID=656061 RepID=D5G732_TUBMM|nr:uncharacterized protein GSTUM_00002320001 [Tuber melanosporum]CAZ80325.1 unnamed protein product [Tuber melanosporum]